MEPHLKPATYGLADTFTHTAGKVFKAILAVFVLLNLISVYAGKSEINKTTLVMLMLFSLALVVFTLVIEPFTFSKHSRLNFASYILSTISCGMILYFNMTYVSAAILLINVIIAGLKLPILKSILLAVMNYGAYIIPVFLMPSGASGIFIYDIYILVIFAALVYLCHYFSSIEYEKVKQDSILYDIMREKAELFRELQQKSEGLDKACWNMVDTLIDIIETRDIITGGHSVKVCQYSVKLAEKLGFNDNDVASIMRAAVLHDIGKIGIPDKVLLKPGPLTEEEYNMIMNHPEIGCNMLSRIKNLEDIVPMVLCHHERIDGTGYPIGLTGDRIPEGAKIIAIADSYDAMVSNRPYRRGLSKKEAQKRLIDGKGTQFEPEFVDKFIEVIDGDNVQNIQDYWYMEGIRKRAETL